MGMNVVRTVDTTVRVWVICICLIMTRNDVLPIR